jgi:hypothetical protein
MSNKDLDHCDFVENRVKLVKSPRQHPSNLASQVKARRCILDINQARAIYRLKFLASTSSSALDAQVSSSALVAAQYGVSSKTIRDIWNRKTWTNATAQPILQEQASSDDRDHAYNAIMNLQVGAYSTAVVSIQSCRLYSN